MTTTTYAIEYETMTPTVRSALHLRRIAQHHVQSLMKCIVARPPLDNNGYWIERHDAFDVGKRGRITPTVLTQNYAIDYFEFMLNLVDFEHRFVNDHDEYAFLIQMEAHKSDMIPDNFYDLASLPMLTLASTHMAIAARFQMCASYLLALRHTPHPHRVLGPNDPMLMHPLDPMLTVCMGTHPRLGRDSPLFTLDSNIIERHILPLLFADKRYVTSLFAPGIPGLFADERYVDNLFAPEIPGLFLDHKDPLFIHTRARVTPSPPLISDVSQPAGLHIAFRNPDGTTTRFHDQNVTPELFGNIPESSVGLCIRENDDVHLFLFSAIIVNGQVELPPEPVRNTKNIKILHWVDENTAHEVGVDDLLHALEPTLVIPTQSTMQVLVLTLDSWEHIRFQISLSPFSERDLQTFRDDARARREISGDDSSDDDSSDD